MEERWLLPTHPTQQGLKHGYSMPNSIHRHTFTHPSNTTRIETSSRLKGSQKSSVFYPPIQHNKDWNFYHFFCSDDTYWLLPTHPTQQGLKLVLVLRLLLTSISFTHPSNTTRIETAFHEFPPERCEALLPTHPTQQGLKLKGGADD